MSRSSSSTSSNQPNLESEPDEAEGKPAAVPKLPNKEAAAPLKIDEPKDDADEEDEAVDEAGSGNKSLKTPAVETGTGDFIVD